MAGGGAGWVTRTGSGWRGGESALYACDPTAFVRRSRAGVVDVAGAGRSGGDRDRVPGASQDGLGGRPRSPPRTRDCGPRSCARRSSSGLPDLRLASVGSTGGGGGGPCRAPRRGCEWGCPLLGREQQEPARTARLLLSEQPCTIPPLCSCNLHGAGTVGGSLEVWILESCLPGLLFFFPPLPAS